MRQVLLGTGIAVFACALAFGQAAENLTFEVASVKPAAPPRPGFLRKRGGPETPDPGQITWSYASLKNLITTAYDVKNYQVSGPAWLDTERYDIVAKVPQGATREQVNVMWQNLLKQRFGAVVHYESKEFRVDELVVAKGGSKLKETTLDPSAALAAEVGPLKFDKNGSPEMATPRFLVGVEEGPNGPTAQMIARAQTLSQLATELGNRLNHPVVDRTGLTGKYDFSIEYTPDLGGIPGLTLPPGAPGAEASEPGSNLAAAIEQQLGLRLVGGKAKLDLVVVDKAERVPTEN